MCGSDSDPDVRYEGRGADERQLREQLGKPRRDGPCRSNLFGGVLWITRRQSQLEYEPCEAVRRNPSGQHGSTG